MKLFKCAESESLDEYPEMTGIKELERLKSKEIGVRLSGLSVLTLGKNLETNERRLIEAGLAIVKIVNNRTEMSRNELEEAAEMIHEVTLRRNKRSTAIPYFDLSNGKKELCRKQVEIGMELNREIISGTVTPTTLKSKFST